MCHKKAFINETIKKFDSSLFAQQTKDKLREYKICTTWNKFSDHICLGCGYNIGKAQREEEITLERF